MAEEITAPKDGHKLCACGKEDCYPCKHELAYCLVCRGGESELARECPGQPLTEDQRNGVCDGSLDYFNGSWQRRKR